jgi:hypothetical protein
VGCARYYSEGRVAHKGGTPAIVLT